VRGLACISEIENYSCGSLAVDRIVHASQISRELPEKERYFGPPGWGWGMGTMTQFPKHIIFRILKLCFLKGPRQPSEHEVIFSDTQIQNSVHSASTKF